MKKNIINMPLRLAVAVAAGIFAVGQAAAGVVSMIGPMSITGGDSTEYTVYQKKPDDCSLSALSATEKRPAASLLQQALAGERGGCLGDGSWDGPGGSVELGNASISDKVITLQGVLMGSPIKLSGLSASDWGKKIGGISLAEKYVFDFIAAHCGIVPGDPMFPDAKQLRKLTEDLIGDLSDANPLGSPRLSYVRGDNEAHDVQLGLAGRMDRTDELASFSCPASAAARLQFSDVVHVQFQALDTYLYGFKGETSGLRTETEGFDASYPLSVPFLPPAVEQSGAVEDTNNVLWTTTWENPNPQSILVRMVVPIPSNSIFWPSFDNSPDVVCKGGIYRLPSPNEPTCRFDPSKGFQGAVVFEGLIGPGMEAQVAYRTASTAGEVAIDVSACWDADGNGIVAEDTSTCERGGFDPISLETAQAMGPGFSTVIVWPVPAVGTAGLAVLVLSLSLVGALRSGRGRR